MNAKQRMELAALKIRLLDIQLVLEHVSTQEMTWDEVENKLAVLLRAMERITEDIARLTKEWSGE